MAAGFAVRRVESFPREVRILRHLRVFSHAVYRARGRAVYRARGRASREIQEPCRDFACTCLRDCAVAVAVGTGRSLGARVRET